MSIYAVYSTICDSAICDEISKKERLEILVYRKNDVFHWKKFHIERELSRKQWYEQEMNSLAPLEKWVT